MSAYNFPNSPSNGDTVNVAGIVYTYDSTDNAWKTGAGQSPAILSNGTTPSLASGITAAEIRTLIDASADPVDLSSVAQNIIPDADSTRDLGTSSKKFRDLYLSGSSLHLGSITIESDATSIVLPQLKIGTGANQVTLSGSNGALQAGGAGITFASLSGKPTTIAGYGITDALTLGTTATTALAGNTALFSGAFSALTGKPTTIAGYGITDALTLGTTATTALAGNTALFSGAFSALTGKPTTIAGYGITDAFSGAFSALSGKPTTIAGYGITDAASTSADIDIGSNDFITTGKVYFANMFAQTSNLPSATTYHGMFAHVHATGAAYFAHGGNWIELANKSYVDTQVSALVDSAPATLNTLNELAAALNDDASFSTTVTNSLAAKAPLASPTLTGTPAAPTASSGTNTTQIATTAFVQAAVSGAGSYNNAAVDTHLNTGTASTNEVLSWNGSDYDWVAQSGGGGGASVTTSDAAPSSPSAGDLWYNTNAGGLFVYYQDANSSQWVEIVGKTGATGPAGGVTASVSDAAPSNPASGQLWWNSSVNKLYIYYTDANSSQWVQATTPGATGPAGPAASSTTYAAVANLPSSGNTVGSFAYITGTNQLAVAKSTTAWSIFNFDATTETATIEYLIVAGGGGGGSGDGAGDTDGGAGGGGAGGVLTASSLSLSGGVTYTITVGAGGAAGATDSAGSNGSNSSIAGQGLTTLTAIGGGGGGHGQDSSGGSDGLAGGSGGGAGSQNNTGGTATSGQGNAGGNTTANNVGGAGGGGAGGAGAASTGGNGAAGGVGVQSSITGTATYYAGGGAGGAGTNTGTKASGGNGGGGDSGDANNNAQAGTANTGGGGGGAGDLTSATGGAGGSGVVIIRTTSTAGTTTGSPIITQDGSHNVYKFTADGSITF